MSAPITINLADYIRDIPDFPKPGIVFKDITPLVKDATAFQATIDQLVDRYKGLNIDHVVGIESRGFIFGAPLALRLGVGFLPVRKPGKLPYQTEKIEYALEYGSGTLEIHADACKAGDRVLIIDDLLATGGTVAGTRALIERLGGQVVAAGFVVELGFLAGREKLDGVDVHALIQY
ncbi:MAG: adenine phosphoribosyltransferase [Candidatus Sericytochromatia bacterium]